MTISQMKKLEMTSCQNNFAMILQTFYSLCEIYLISSRVNHNSCFGFNEFQIRCWNLKKYIIKGSKQQLFLKKWGKPDKFLFCRDIIWMKDEGKFWCIYYTFKLSHFRILYNTLFTWMLKGDRLKAHNYISVAFCYITLYCKVI